MYHAACKVEFQPFKRLYSQLMFSTFLLIFFQVFARAPIVYVLLCVRTRMYLAVCVLHINRTVYESTWWYNMTPRYT